ncbi:MAG: LysR family transcriptional regulator [Micrococcales bacterium]|nr:LysR family transcriptional regulator [Micrococcales bacterium]
MIDPRLRVLRVVAERGTITAAAQDLNYTPSAVSHQLRTLSRDVGAPLIEQEGRGIRLTTAATTLLARSDELFALWEGIRAEVHRSSGTGLGHLNLAGFSTAASALLPAVAATAVREFPESHVRIIEADPAVCFEMLLADQVDVAVVVVGTHPLPSSGDPRFEQHPLLEDQLDLLVPAGHPLAERRSATLADAAGERWIMDRPGRPHHQLVLSACAAAGFSPAQAHEVIEWDTGAALVAAGLGVALVPRLARLPAGEEFVRVPLRGADSPVRHVRTGIRRGTADQPEIALALRELQRVASLVQLPPRESG